MNDENAPAPEAPDAEPATREAAPYEFAPRRRGRRRLWLQFAAGVVVLAIVAIVVAVIVSNQHSAEKTLAASTELGPKNMVSGGALLTGVKGQIVTATSPAEKIGQVVPTDATKLTSVVNIVEYVDLQCPYCLQFEVTNLSNTANLVAGGTVSLEIHPIAILDRSSEGTRYSSRAANAMACVANFLPDEFLNALAVLYEFQPQENTPGLTNAQILGYLKKAKVAGADITKCVDHEAFRTWVTATTTSVENGMFAGVATTPTTFQGTPTVFANGVPYIGSLTDPQAFATFVDAQSKNTTG